MASELDEWWIHGALLAQVSGILSTLGAVLLRLALKSAVGYCQALGCFWSPGDASRTAAAHNTARCDLRNAVARVPIQRRLSHVSHVFAKTSGSVKCGVSFGQADTERVSA